MSYKSDDEMKAAARFVQYEWAMLEYAWNRLPKTVRDGHGRTGTGYDCEDDAVVECFLLHARVLRDFYRQRRNELKGRAATNIVAEDFFDEPEKWHLPALAYLAETEKTRLDRALAHLAYDRSDYVADEQWNLRLAWEELHAAQQTFLHELLESQRGWFILPDNDTPAFGESEQADAPTFKAVDLEQTTGTPSPVEQWNAARSMLDHYQTVLNQRFTWMTAIQGFVFTAFALTVNAAANSKTEEMANLLWVGVVALCIVGGILPWIFFRPIARYGDRLQDIRKWWEELGHANFPPLVAEPKPDPLSRIESLPLVATTAWLVALLFATWALRLPTVPPAKPETPVQLRIGPIDGT